MWIDSSAEEIAAAKGSPTTPGKDSPFRSRSAAENLDLFIQDARWGVQGGGESFTRQD